MRPGLRAERAMVSPAETQFRGIYRGAGRHRTPRFARRGGPFDYAQGRLRPPLHMQGEILLVKDYRLTRESEGRLSASVAFGVLSATLMLKLTVIFALLSTA
jgi:hypothetical protein